MALQINVALNTKQGFTVSAGSYVWLYEERGGDRQYKVDVLLRFYKDKASFDLHKAPFDPVEIEKLFYSQTFTAVDYSILSPLAIHQFIQGQLAALLGANSVSIVQ